MLIRITNISVLVLLIIVSFGNLTNGDPSVCSSKNTCGSCIRTLGCMWCAQPVETLAKDTDIATRCLHQSETAYEKWCSREHTVNPSSVIEITDNKTLTTGVGKEEAIQISPQRIRLKLRLGEEKSIAFKYQQAVGYPVDLYYLMDLSASMADDKDKLSLLGSKLINAMKAITNNFRIGFGSFVDKPEMPYVNTIPSKYIPFISQVHNILLRLAGNTEGLAQPCTLRNNEPCAPPYSFKNQLPLNADTDLFVREVKKARVSGNMDHPEGGFDGLMQVLVCKNQIGWREKARKLLVFSTDAGFHLAGDGKLAGIVEPNDGLCHLDNNGSYTQSLLQDYPSIAMLDMKARENNINIIFAVTKNQDGVYKMLKENIYGASHGTLSKDSSNVVDLVKAEYDKLVESIFLSDDAGGSIDIKYYSKCLGTEEKPTNECGNLHGRPELEFRAVVKAVSCPENKDKWKQVVNIKPGALNETLTLEIEIICQCDCEKEKESSSEVESTSAECSGGGTLQCGVCSCDSGRYGKYCECDGNKASNTTNLGECTPNNITDQVCSGLGFCRCGKCECSPRSKEEERIYGTYCECDNYSCKRSGGLVCSGPEKGRCDCGQCICESGWSGSACECRENNATCIAPESGEVCSGHGTCECGSCQCYMTDKFRYSGQYCEECPHCTETKCTQLKDCVECQVHKSGTYSESECNLKCTAFQAEVVDKVQVNEESDIYTERICRLPDDSGCTIIFKYKYEEDNVSLKVYAEKDKQCAAVIDVFSVVFGVVGSTVIAGLILLIVWKILTTVHDRREFQRFEKETLLAKWDRGDNPLYKPSTSLFNNPTFKGQ